MTDKEKKLILDPDEHLFEEELEDLVDLGMFDDDDSIIEDIVSGDLGVLEDYE